MYELVVCDICCGCLSMASVRALTAELDGYIYMNGSLPLKLNKTGLCKLEMVITVRLKIKKNGCRLEDVDLPVMFAICRPCTAVVSQPQVLMFISV